MCKYLENFSLSIIKKKFRVIKHFFLLILKLNVYYIYLFYVYYI